MTTTQMILDALKRLAGSMKAWTLVLGLLTTLGAKYGFNVDPTTFWVIVGGFATLLGAQGATDWGKSASTVMAAVPPTTMLTGTVDSPKASYLITKDDGTVNILMNNGDHHDITSMITAAGYAKVTTPTIVKTPQGGFAALWLMALINVVALSVIVIALVDCTAPQKAEVKAVENNFIACAKVDFQAQVVPVASVLIAHPSDTVAKLDAIGLSAGQDVLACAVKVVVDVLTTGTSHAAPSQAVLIGQSFIAQHNFHYVGE